MKTIRTLASREIKAEVLAIVSSHDKLGDPVLRAAIGSLLAHPYLLLNHAGYEAEVASPKIGISPKITLLSGIQPAEGFLPSSMKSRTYVSQRLMWSSRRNARNTRRSARQSDT